MYFLGQLIGVVMLLTITEVTFVIQSAAFDEWMGFF